MTAAAFRPSAEERWQGASLPVRRISATMMLIALVSAAGHLAILAGAALESRAPPPPPQEIAVEIVHDVPKAIAKAPAPPKDEQAKPDLAKPDLTKLDLAKPEPAEPEPSRPEPAKREPAKPEPAAARAKAEPPKPQAQSDLAAEEQKLASLQQELTSLKAEQEQLRAERATPPPSAETARPAPLRETGLGPLPDSFSAVALPTSADGRGEAVSYEATVFSALAKAKGIGGSWLLPGTASVHFDIDSVGHLLDVSLVHGSGVAELDREALDIVRRAAPFAPPPQGAQRSFDANFTFKTQQAAR